MKCTNELLDLNRALASGFPAGERMDLLLLRVACIGPSVTCSQKLPEDTVNLGDVDKCSFSRYQT